MKINSRHSTRTNNIAKVKYHLPTPALHERRNSNSHSQLHSNSNTRKHSVKAHERVDRSAQNVLVDFMKERHDLSFEIMGVSDLSNVRTEKTRIDGKENFSMFPQGREKEEFVRFVEELKDDKDYQSTVTMFTIMYFYAKKNGGKAPKLI